VYFSKKAAVPIEEEETDIWACTTDGCSCWMRENFSFEKSPTCPFCQGEMTRDTRMLPVLANHTKRTT